MAILFMAEDDPLMSRMYERAFRLGGHDLKMAFDGEEAVKTLQTMDPKPSLIILDVMMPKESGFQVLEKVKSDEKLKTIPVILLTNLAGQEDAEKGLSMGAVMYLVKSQYNPKQVVEKVEELIKASTRGDGVPEVKVKVADIPKATPTPTPSPAPAAPITPAPATPLDSNPELKDIPKTGTP